MGGKALWAVLQGALPQKVKKIMNPKIFNLPVTED